MGKYRTCGYNNASSASENCNSGASVKNSQSLSRSAVLGNSQNHKNQNGNCWGKFEGDQIKLGESDPLPRRSRHLDKSSAPLQSIRRTLYVIALGASILFILTEQVHGESLAETQETILRQGSPVLDQQRTTDSVTGSSGNEREGENRGLIDKQNKNDDDEEDGALGGNPFLVQPANCSHSSAEDFPPDIFSIEAKRHGAILFHFFVAVYLCYAILLVCQEYFVPSVESVCRALHVPSEVVGATWMAISTSAPELFTNVIGTFLTNGDMGVGTIVGSAVFNILAVGACCGIGAGYFIYKSSTTPSNNKIGVRLEWWPLTRDSIFYLASVATLIGVLYNRKVYWSEALFMLALYAFYVLVLCFNTRVKGWVEKCLAIIGLQWVTGSKEGPRRLSGIIAKKVNANEKTPLLLLSGETEKRTLESDNNNWEAIKEVTSSHPSLVNLTVSQELSDTSMDEVLIHNALVHSSGSHSTPVEECSTCCKWPSFGAKTWYGWLISWPIRFLLYVTIPDCRTYTLRNWYWATLGMCVVWIGVLTYGISWMVTIIGETFSIPDSVLGLTFLAAGTSIPEVISSLIVASQGLGSMGFSNSVGSNIFDCLVCLGLPWLIKAALLSSEEINYVEIHSGGLEYSAIILVLALFVLYFAIAVNGFILDKKIGLICVFMYIVFISFACMLEMNVFFPVNLPSC